MEVEEVLFPMKLKCNFLIQRFCASEEYWFLGGNSEAELLPLDFAWVASWKHLVDHRMLDYKYMESLVCFNNTLFVYKVLVSHENGKLEMKRLSAVAE